jgi:hypothetical protein
VESYNAVPRLTFYKQIKLCIAITILELQRFVLLNENFKLVVYDDLGMMVSILGIRAIRDRKRRTLTIYQYYYVDVVLRKFKLYNDKTAKTPKSQGYT